MDNWSLVKREWPTRTVVILQVLVMAAVITAVLTILFL